MKKTIREAEKILVRDDFSTIIVRVAWKTTLTNREIIIRKVLPRLLQSEHILRGFLEILSAYFEYIYQVQKIKDDKNRNKLLRLISTISTMSFKLPEQSGQTLLFPASELLDFESRLFIHGVHGTKKFVYKMISEIFGRGYYSFVASVTRS